jgi:hypothetical protein
MNPRNSVFIEEFLFVAKEAIIHSWEDVAKSAIIHSRKV